MKTLLMIIGVLSGSLLFALEASYVSFTNTQGKATTIAFFGTVRNVQVTCGTNSLPYVVTTTNMTVGTSVKK